jgi:NAD(P)H-hydrate epimerase
MLAELRQEAGGGGGLSLKVLEEKPLGGLLKGISVVGIGPGLGQDGSTPEWVRRFVEKVTLPMVIDADALNAIAGRGELLKRASAMKDAKGKGRTIVLTPHPGEMARLVEMTVAEVEADRVGLARKFATEHGVTLVLKGWRTLVAHPDGRIAVNTTGNPSMAKGGSGDILTGIVSAMLAQYADDVASAVEAAVFLHGLAGDFACLAQDEHTVLATDTVGHLWQAFRARVVDADGFTWISGTATNGASA